MPQNKPIPAGFWIGGVNSLLDPNALKSTEYQWGTNVSNRGGIISTRQGFAKDTFGNPGTATATITTANQSGDATIFTTTNESGDFVVGEPATVTGGIDNNGTFLVIGLDEHQIIVRNPGGTTQAPNGGTITAMTGVKNPQGMTLFQPKDKKVHKVVAADGRIWVSEYPFTEYQMLSGEVSLPITAVDEFGGQALIYVDGNPRDFGLWGPVIAKGTENGDNDGTYDVITFRGNNYVALLSAPGTVDNPEETGTLTSNAPLNFYRSDYPPVFFETTIKNVEEDADGNLKVVDPYPVLIMGTGFHRQAMWDGKTARHLSPSEAFVGALMKWIGGRLWTASGTLLHAGNLLDPLSTSEESLIADGGYFSFPSEITGLGATPDQKSLLVFTDYTTYAIQAGITDRTQWRQTLDFQRVLLPGIGCAAPKSVCNQFGLTWWYSHGGLIGIDSALQTYHTSKVHYKDEQMMRSKSTLSPSIKGICCGVSENNLLVSVPSGDRHNAHTWVLDQSVLETNDSLAPAAWSGVYTGVRPVDWASGIVEGVSRIFCLSRDYFDSNYEDYSSRPWMHKIGVWEAFIGEKMDIPGLSGIANRPVSESSKRIPCSFETKMLGLGEGGALSEFCFAELDLAEIEGIVDLEVLYAGRRGGYTSILTKTLTAASGSVGWPFRVVSGDVDPTIEEDSVIQFFRPQTRMVRSVSVTGGRLSPNDSGSAEGIFNQNIDRSFSLLVKWTGKMSVLGLRIFTMPHIEPGEGKCEPDETDDTAVTMEGRKLSSTYPPIQGSTTISLLKSLFRRNLTPRFTDEFYSST